MCAQSHLGCLLLNLLLKQKNLKNKLECLCFGGCTCKDNLSAHVIQFKYTNFFMPAFEKLFHYGIGTNFREDDDKFFAIVFLILRSFVSTVRGEIWKTSPIWSFEIKLFVFLQE